MIRIQTGRRLHFGLFTPLPVVELDLAYGGLGMMVDEPGVVVEADYAKQWSYEGESLERVKHVISIIQQMEPALKPAAIRVCYVAPTHQGWGTGTQLALGVARACYESSRLPWSAKKIASQLGRGKRSGIGVVGFERGGLLLDPGRLASRGESNESMPEVVSHQFPKEWSIVLVEPGSEQGLHSDQERQAFTQLTEIDQRIVNRLRGLANESIEAAKRVDFVQFAEQLTEYNRLAGSFYRTVQHGDYSSALNEERLSIMRECGAIGRGQSSWGPGLYGLFSSQREAEAFCARCHLAGCDMHIAHVMSGAQISQSS